MLDVGAKAPSFALEDQDSNVRTLEEFAGQKVILYFYHRDMRSGCTSQACSFANAYPHIREKGAVVVGVSADSVESHKRFQEEHDLPFTLLSDPEMQAMRAYDVFEEGTRFGKPATVLVRTTYLIDEDGVIVQAFGKVKPKESADQVLRALV
ncbi:MAG: peroxiredoxin [Coriobacteriales bacterium]|nr:peroxiredoxin [Coriobacteriales bacterium]